MYYRRLPNRTIFDDVNRLQREMNALFNAYYPSRAGQGGGAQAAGYPALNLWSGEDAVVVTAELPGMHAEDIEISVVGESLTIKGQRQTEALPQAAFYHRQERGFGKFSRTIELPFPVNSDQVSASLQKGVLTIELPRAEADKPRKISVNTKTMLKSEV